MLCHVDWSRPGGFHRRLGVCGRTFPHVGGRPQQEHRIRSAALSVFPRIPDVVLPLVHYKRTFQRVSSDAGTWRVAPSIVSWAYREGESYQVTLSSNI